MSDFFENKQFLNKMSTLPYGQSRIMEIMKEIKEKIPELSIDTFICILDKKIDPSISYMSRSSSLYKSSVELWNQYVFDNYKCDFDLLIGYNNICF